jgi:AraC family transcriptional regulator
MQEDLIGEMRLENGLIEVRRYAWSEPELLTFHRENYMMSRLLTSSGPKRPFGWRVPCTTHSVPAIQLSVVAPKSPVSVAFEEGEAIIVSCILSSEYFERTTGITDWNERHTLLCLGLRSPLIGLIFNRLAHEVYHSRFGSGRFAEAFVNALTVEVARGIERSFGERPVGQLAQWQLQQIYNMVEDETLERRLTIDQIAHHCGFSPRHLMRAFKGSTGLTLHQYASEVRMRRAMAALNDNRMPLKVLAAKLGFGSASAFSAAFRQAVGCAPSEFRHRARLH